MTPQTELCVPKSEPIPVREIPLSPMATFLKESHPGLEFEPSPTYHAIFSELRGLPLDEQEKLLVGFYSQKVEAFPNGAELGRFLARINNISWFQPKSRPNRESLGRLYHQALSRLNLHDLPLRIISQSWAAAWEAKWNAHHKAIQASIIWGALSDADGDPTRGSVPEEDLAEALHKLRRLTSLEEAPDKAEATAYNAPAHVEIRDASMDTTLKGALLDAGIHPGDPTRDAAVDAALHAVMAHETARKAVYTAARDEARDAAYAVLDRTPDMTAKWDRAREARVRAEEDATLNAGRAAEWIVVKDLMPHTDYNKGNPFESLVGIYELGCWPIGISDQNEEMEFVVFIPPFKKPPKTTSSLRQKSGQKEDTKRNVYGMYQNAYSS